MTPSPPSDDQARRPLPTKAQEHEAPQQRIHAMLAAIWERSKTTVAQRVELLREATADAAGNRLDEPGRLRAVDSAHKLAGVLGTFGLPRGTELAREAEETFGKPEPLGQFELERLRRILEELDGLVRTAHPSNRTGPS
jgi:HPt (histidine-containing phosphotransfer) domain-containing protein